MTTFLSDKRVLWVIFISLAVMQFAIFGLTGYIAGEGNWLMPLDDVYIHFQYARQFAEGHPYQYNLSDPPTSGATSLLYPYLLAGGYVLGFQGLWLGMWAMMLGSLTLVASLWAVYRLCVAMNATPELSLATSVLFGVTGSLAWHFMSGMETGIVVTLTLWTLVAVIEKRLPLFVIVGTLLTLMRPEGGVLAAIAAGTLFLRLWADYGRTEKDAGRRWQLVWLALPVLAIGAQPLLNLLITGTTVATGNQAKSILATVPYDPIVIAERIWDNFSRMWVELATGYDAREGHGWYLPLGVGVIGLLAMPMLLFKRDYRLVGLMLLGWFVAVIGAVSTLDNAFWHFKRYQMPLHALLYPMAAWVLIAVMARMPKAKYAVYGFVGVMSVFAIGLLVQFQGYHALNVSYVYQQPYQMGVWLRDNTPEDATVAVHDVGLMRYVGERETLDMVGLTTPGAAAYWRNGPGSIAEWLLNVRPDYIASYGRGHGYGLGLLEDTALYENEVASFGIADWRPEANVALAANRQAIYEMDWDSETMFYTTIPDESFTNCVINEAELGDGMTQIAILDVGDIASENAFDYVWQSSPANRYATEARSFSIDDSTQTLTDSYRVLLGGDAFTIDTACINPDSSLFLFTTVHAEQANSINIYVNETLIDTQWIPQMPGELFIITTAIPADYVDSLMSIALVVQDQDSVYLPVSHDIRQYAGTGTGYPFMDSAADTLNFTSLASYQDGAFHLEEVILPSMVDIRDAGLFTPTIQWFVPTLARTEGDYLFFVHVYDDRNSPPVAQWDNYYAGTPVGNWLTGDIPPELIQLNIADVPAGTYEVAIGFYNPQDPTDRLIPESDVYEVTPDGRLWLGELEIE